ncbi:MAG: arginine--tRNA ligase [Parcubacteria group bacterium CG1_02_50_68]|nr:MAG: arginine--tRNA ligase [Parcubacteria group bacterium CG1_02_50_68]
MLWYTRYMEERIRKAITKALAKIGAPETKFTVERPSDPAHGDYATNVALVMAKILGRNPHELAEQIAEKVRTSNVLTFQKVEVAGPGFTNITLAREAVTLAIAEANSKGAEWGKGSIKSKERVLIEYSNPNAFKEMHIGHLIGTVVGESLSRLIEYSGAKVARDTFGGDVGPNVAKAIWGLRKKGITNPTTAREIGEVYTDGSHAYENDPQAKEEIDELNQAIYASTNKELMELWRQGRNVSMEEFRRIWRILGTHFDFEFFDSDTVEIGLRVVNDGLHKGIFEKSDGAIIYNGGGKGVHTMVFITSHGTPTYEAKDIGLAFLKEERWPSNEVIIVTGNEQKGRFGSVLKALSEIAPLLAKKTRHISTGFLKLASGKMSSREGTVITAVEFIHEVAERASEKNADPLIAEQVALGAIKYMILRQAPGSDIIFDEEKSLSLEGDSGPYLQYAFVRAKSVLVAAEERGNAPVAGTPENPYFLERLIIHFPEVVSRATRELSPNLLVNYLTELAGEWNSFYAHERIIDGDYEAHKLLIARAFVNTMTNGLTLLGIPAPDKM